MNDVANEVVRGGLTYSFLKILKYLILSLISLSASNDSCMHFQGHMEERYSTVPEIQYLHYGDLFTSHQLQLHSLLPYFLTSSRLSRNGGT